MIDEISKTCRLCSSDNLEEVIDVGKTTPQTILMTHMKK